MPHYTDQFRDYFSKDVAQKAAKSLKNGCNIHLSVGNEKMTFTKQAGLNSILEGGDGEPEISFQMTEKAADKILANESEEIGEIGVEIAKLIVSDDPDISVSIKLHAGFFTLFSKGYLGVVTAGGSAFASFLASRGLGGMSGIKSAIKKMSSK